MMMMLERPSAQAGGGAPPVHVTRILKDGSYEVAPDADNGDVAAATKLLHDRIMYKLAYRGSIGDARRQVLGFVAPGIKGMPTRLLLHVDGRLLAYSGPSAPKTGTVLLDVNAALTSWTAGVRHVLPEGKQALLFGSDAAAATQLVLLRSATALGAVVPAR